MDATDVEVFRANFQNDLTYAYRLYMAEYARRTSDVGFIMNRENGPGGPPAQSQTYELNWTFVCGPQFPQLFPHTATSYLRRLEMPVLPILRLMYAQVSMPALETLTFHFHDKAGMRGGQPEYSYDPNQAWGGGLVARNLTTVRVVLKNTRDLRVAANMVDWVSSKNGLAKALISGANVNETRRLGEIVVCGWKYVPTAKESFGAIQETLVKIAAKLDYSHLDPSDLLSDAAP